jgi:hypothetical protein
VFFVVFLVCVDTRFEKKVKWARGRQITIPGTVQEGENVISEGGGGGEGFLIEIDTFC